MLDGTGVVLSAEQQLITLFGGTERKRVRRDTLWTYSLLDGTWQRTPLAKEGRPGEVLAAAYRAEDRSVYEVDLDGRRPTVRKLILGEDRFRTLGELPASWRRFEQYWLVPASSGDLLIAATRPGLSVVARLRSQVEEDRPRRDKKQKKPRETFKVAGLTVMRETLLDRPYGGDSGMTLVVQGADGQNASTRFVQFAGQKCDSRDREWFPELD
jgi:hypothetical protein